LCARISPVTATSKARLKANRISTVV